MASRVQFLQSNQSQQQWPVRRPKKCSKTYLQNSVTDKARDSISGYSYNGDYYNEAIAELTRNFGKPQYIVAAYLDQLEKWAKPRLDEPNTFVSFSSFLRRLEQTFRLHNFEADLKSSAVLRMARDKLNRNMIIRRNHHTRNQGLLQPNLTILLIGLTPTQRRVKISPHNGNREPE